MPWFARDAGVWRTIADPRARVAGVWQPIQNGWVRVAGAWQKFYQRFRISVSPTLVTGSNSRSGSGNVTAATNAATGTPTGGIGIIQYQWQYVSGDTATVANPTSASTTFSRTVFVTAPNSVTRSGVYRLRAIDNNGAGDTVFSQDVTVETTHEAF